MYRVKGGIDIKNAKSYAPARFFYCAIFWLLSHFQLFVWNDVNLILMAKIFYIFA